MAVVAGCGDNARTPTSHGSTTVARTTSTSLAQTEERYNAIAASALVTMRQLSPQSLMWQSVAVKADGTALLTTLIGELAGAPRRTFQLPARQAALLRRLVVRARGAGVPSWINPRAKYYTLHIRGEQALVIEGPMPRRLAALVNFLSGLMFTYCC